MLHLVEEKRGSKMKRSGHLLYEEEMVVVEKKEAFVAPRTGSLR